MRAIYIVSYVLCLLSISACKTLTAEQYYLLGLSYQSEYSSNQDLKLAFRNFKSAAKLNHIESACLTADAYHRGSGVKENIQKALSWYERCITNGNYLTMVSIGYIYEQEPYQDREQALAWYFLADSLASKYGSKTVENAIVRIKKDMTFNEIENAKTLYYEYKKSLN